MLHCCYLTAVKWKPLEFAALLKLLKPVESSWEELAYLILKDELQCKIKTISANAFHSRKEKALDEVLIEWQKCAERGKLTWQTLSDTAKKCGDQSLELYIQQNSLECELNVTILCSWCCIAAAQIPQHNDL